MPRSNTYVGVKSTLNKCYVWPLARVGLSFYLTLRMLPTKRRGIRPIPTPEVYSYTTLYCKINMEKHLRLAYPPVSRPDRYQQRKRLLLIDPRLRYAQIANKYLHSSRRELAVGRKEHIYLTKRQYNTYLWKCNGQETVAKAKHSR